MRHEEVARLWERHREPGFGTMQVPELVRIGELVESLRPSAFLEVGTASGLTSGIVARMLDEHGGRRLVTVDLQERFYADPSREAGFVVPLVYPGGPDAAVEVVRLTGTTSVDLVARGETFELALIDAGHAHPWPLIDTLCVNVVLEGSRTLVHDDLTLFRRRLDGRGIGPKILFDQFPESHRTRFDDIGGNLFTVSLDLPRAQLEQIAIDAFSLPWTLNSKIAPEVVTAFEAVLDEHYGPRLGEAFRASCGAFNKPNGRYWRRP